MPIPIVSIANLLSFIFCLVLAVALYRSFSKNSENIYISSFFYATVFLTTMFLLISVPGVMTGDPLLVAWITYIFSEPPALLAAMFFAKIPLQLFGWKTAYRVYFSSIIIISLSVSLLRYLGLEETRVVEQGRFEFYLRPDNEMYLYAATLAGVTILLTLLFAFVSYIYLALKNRENRIVFQRSLLLGLATILFLFAVVTNYFGEMHLSLAMLFASIFCVLALICMIIAVFYIRPS